MPQLHWLSVLLLIGNLAAAAYASAADSASGQATFTNPIAVGQDPSVVRDGDRYLWCQSDRYGVAIYVSDTLTRLGTKHYIWLAPRRGPFAKEIWAPELMSIDDRWYIYFAASDGRNINHRTYVLASQSSDPLGDYRLFGPLYTGDHYQTQRCNLWAIDMTVLQHRDRLYAIWSGWTTIDSDVQCLYIAPMNSPTAIDGNRVMISQSDDYLWERVDETPCTRGLNEGPQLLQRGGRTFVVYSCSASWLPSYKLGMLELIGDDPLDPRCWKKYPEPVFQSTVTTFGVGHGSFVESPDGSWWHTYHAKDECRPGWKRSIYVQPMLWTTDGLPDFGSPVRPGQRLPIPATASGS